MMDPVDIPDVRKVTCRLGVYVKQLSRMIPIVAVINPILFRPQMDDNHHPSGYITYIPQNMLHLVQNRFCRDKRLIHIPHETKGEINYLTQPSQIRSTRRTTGLTQHTPQ